VFRFSNDHLRRFGGRRLKSAKARNRGGEAKTGRCAMVTRLLLLPIAEAIGDLVCQKGLHPCATIRRSHLHPVVPGRKQGARTTLVQYGSVRQSSESGGASDTRAASLRGRPASLIRIFRFATGATTLRQLSSCQNSVCAPGSN
jgi:hypothetical protein